jgi:hypothetical protein
LPGKYAHITPNLPPLPPVDETYQQRINEVKSKILNYVPTSQEGQAPTPFFTTLEEEEQDYDEVRKELSQIEDSVNVVEDTMLEVCRGRRTATGFARAYHELRNIADFIDKQESRLNLLLEAYTALLIDQFEVEGSTSVRLDDGTSVSVQYEPYAQVQDREAFRQWCVKEGLERSMTLPWQTTNALVKDKLLAGQPEPPGIKAFTRPKPVLRRAKD